MNTLKSKIGVTVRNTDNFENELTNRIKHAIDVYDEDTDSYIITSSITLSKSMVIDKRVLDVLTVGQTKKLYQRLDDQLVKFIVLLAKPFMKENKNEC